jgi:integrase
VVYRRNRGDGEAWLVAVPTRHRRFKRSTGTTHKPTAKAMERMLVVLGPKGQRAYDSRHFYAIRAIRAGTPYELVARQLGHADVAMVAKVYGRFAPRSDERDRWEKIAAAQDQTSEKKIGRDGCRGGCHREGTRK